MKKKIFKTLVIAEQYFWKWIIRFAGKDFNRWMGELNDEFIEKYNLKEN